VQAFSVPLPGFETAAIPRCYWVSPQLPEINTAPDRWETAQHRYGLSPDFPHAPSDGRSIEARPSDGRSIEARRSGISTNQEGFVSLSLLAQSSTLAG
jgi:hypothetical protein